MEEKETMKRINALFIALVTLSCVTISAVSIPVCAEKIQDNSFLIEEAYNQEKGVVQHINVFQYNRDKSWGYAFTQEWPVPNQSHQLSYTIPVLHLAPADGGRTGIGDIALNYRYQVLSTDLLALAPRLSLSFPSGSYRKGLGTGSFGVQVNIPFSAELSKHWVMHWNAGTTITPRRKEPGGAKADTYGFNFGTSVILTAWENFNPMFEAIWISDEEIDPTGAKSRTNSLFINPGFRAAINFDCGLQIVPGLSAPIGVGPSRGNYGALLYLSFEHPFL